jgi:choline dehydrogenase-like flavoprotein
MDEADVVIVGSGAAGSVMAATLAGGGKKVLVLEGGPDRSPQDLYSSQIWARRVKWFGPATETGGPDPISVGFGSGWGTGGASLHHYGVWLRRHPDDFTMQSQFGQGFDWPMQYQDLRPFYDDVQEEVGLSGDAAAEVWRPDGDPYPMPPLAILQQGKLLARGFAAQGLRTSPLPLAINSVPYKGRPACVQHGWCDAGCPILALANPLAVYLPMARKAGAELVNDATVTRVLTEPSGKRATGVEFFDRQGKRQVARARVVVVAAYAFQTPRLLLNSAASSHPNGLANSSGRLGLFMMTHISGNVYGFFPEPTENYRGTVGGQLLCQDEYTKNPARGYINSSQWLIANALKPNDLLGLVNARPLLFGSALHTFMEKAAKYLATMTFVGENLPNADNRLRLSPRKDRYGMPLAQVTHAFGRSDVACYDAGMTQGEKIFRSAGAEEVWTTGHVRMHAMGGAIMGRDPQSSVTNSYGQTHDVANLFVAGPSLFPTSAAVNPNFTIHAVSLRSAKYMLNHWGSLS